MKKLLSLGVSDPLTLGMAHPVADRLETLGRARPTTWRSRFLALGAMSVIALASAPHSIASDHPEKVKTETRFKFISNFDGEKGESYEIVTEDGERKAYRILEGGEREPAVLEEDENGGYRLTYSDGKTVDLPSINFEKLEGLKGLKGLAALKSLKGLEGLDGLAALKSLEGLNGLSNLEGLESGDVEIRILNSEDHHFSGDGSFENLAEFPERLRELLQSKDGSKQIKIIKRSELGNKFSFHDKDGESFDLPDTFVDMRFEFNQDDDPLGMARRQLDETKRQLETLSDDKNLSFDLKNALRDIESAQQSLEEAENRLLDSEK